MRINPDDLPRKYQQQIELQLGSTRSRKYSGKNGKPEPTTHNALENRTQAPNISTPVYLVVLFYRTAGRKWDLDNFTFKPFLDGLVQEGVLKDDSIKEIKGLIKLPKPVEKESDERTVMEFWDADYFEAYIDAARRGAIANH